MKEYILERQIISNIAVLGSLYEGRAELCKTLENPYLNNHPNISCIPCGKYQVKKYSSSKYPNVWEVQNVIDRSHILFHSGNVADNTEGCILVGSKFGFIGEELAILQSKLALDKLRTILPDEFILHIKDRV